jgi:protocatechuate 3,4-dioxygenase beta subunit
MRLTGLFLFVAVCLAAQPGSVEGTVVDQATGRPLGNVHIRLLTGDVENGGLDQAYGAISDGTGYFAFPELKPGLYMVILDRVGYVEARGKSAIPVSTIPLKAGQHITGHKLEMTARSIIAGRVVDDFGDPVQGVQVELHPVPPDTESFSFFGQGNGATDDRGEFRLLTAPGRYYLKATPANFYSGAPPEIRTDGTPAAPFVVTYYPSASGTGGASAVQTAPGQDVTGLEIRLTRDAAGARPALTISGTVSGMPEGERANVVAVSRDGEGRRAFGSSSSSTEEAGRFTIGGLEPGSYTVFAQYSAGKTHLRSTAVDIQLASGNPPSIQLTMQQAEDIAGTLEITGGAKPGEKFTVALDPVDGFYGNGPETAEGDAGKDGAFHIPNVPLGRLKVRVDPLPENAFVRSVALDGVAAKDSTIDLSHGVKGSRLKITVSRNGAQISGRVLGRDGEPLVSPLGMVMLWKDSDQTQPEPQRASAAKYTLNALAPGKYRLLAIDGLEASEFFMGGDDDAMMKALKDAAEEIEVKEGDRIAKDLKVIGKEAIHVKQ